MGQRPPLASSTRDDDLANSRIGATTSGTLEVRGPLCLAGYTSISRCHSASERAFPQPRDTSFRLEPGAYRVTVARLELDVAIDGLCGSYVVVFERVAHEPVHHDRVPWAPERPDRMYLSDEADYAKLLAQERHMFAWCLATLKGTPVEDAEKRAAKFYFYEEGPDRSMGFTDDAWHHAMLEIHGDNYWVRRPDLQRPSQAYADEHRRIGGQWDYS